MDCWDPGRHWVLFHPHAVPGQESTGAGVPGGAALGAQHVPVLPDCRVPNRPQRCRQDPDQVLRGVGHAHPPGRYGRGNMADVQAAELRNLGKPQHLMTRKQRKALSSKAFSQDE